MVWPDERNRGFLERSLKKVLCLSERISYFPKLPLVHRLSSPRLDLKRNRYKQDRGEKDVGRPGLLDYKRAPSMPARTRICILLTWVLSGDLHKDFTNLLVSS